MLTAILAIGLGVGFALVANRKSRRRHSRVSSSTDPFLIPIDTSPTDASRPHEHDHHHGGQHGHHDGGGGHHSFDGGHHGGFDGGGFGGH